MVKLDHLIFGFLEIEILEENISRAATIFLRNGISMKQKENCKILVFYIDKYKVEQLLGDAKIEYKIIKCFVPFGQEKSKLRKVILLSAALLTTIFVVLMSNTVWRIEIGGNDKISDVELEYELRESGLSIGSNWKKIDFGKVEASLLEKRQDLAWININRSGMVAYVSVIEANLPNTEEEKKYEFSNIVAKEDCIIEHISVSRGVAMVGVGDAVRKGDVLILGVKSKDDQSQLCAAEGEVIGRVNKTVNVSLSRENHRKLTEKMCLSSVKIKILNFSVNIFKKYGNLGDKYDIIEEKAAISIFQSYKLPIEIIKQYKICYTDEKYMLSDDDMILLASQKMRALVQKTLENVELNSIKTRGNFSDEGYIMSTEIIYSCDVCENVEISVEGN